MEFTIEGELPTLNIVINKSKTHWAVYKNLKEEATEACMYYMMKDLGKQRTLEKPVELTFVWYRPNKKNDPDNIAHGCKYIIDGMVLGGLIPNDGWKNIAMITHKFEMGEAKTRVFISETESDK